MYQAVINKYAAPPAPEVDPDPVIDPEPDQFIQTKQSQFDTSMDAWKQFPAVVALSAFLRENNDMGIRLVLLDGRPTLHFNPGIYKTTSPERMDVIGQAFDLLLGALPDLEHLVTTGQHIIPNHPGYAVPSAIAGPSRRRKA